MSAIATLFPRTPRAWPRALGRFPSLSVLAAVLCLLAACAKPVPPVGRWEGLYQDDGVMIAARLEITPDGVVHVSAPNAFMDFAAMSDGAKSDMRGRLLSDLDRSWPYVGALPLDFDGTVFRKPGGVAPQMEWDSKAKRMMLVVYAGTHAAIRVPLSPVENFGDGQS